MILNQGKHRAKAINWALGEAGTGTKQIGVEFDLLDRAGDTISWYGYFTEKALDSTVKALRAMGWQGADLSELDARGGGLDGQEVLLVVEHEPEKDEQGQQLVDESGAVVMRARVRWVNSLGGVAMKKPLAGDDLKAFAAELRGKILALDPSSAAKRAAAPRATAPSRPTPPAHRDEDIPF